MRAFKLALLMLIVGQVHGGRKPLTVTSDGWGGAAMQRLLTTRVDQSNEFNYRSLIEPTNTCFEMLKEDPALFCGLVANARCKDDLTPASSRSYCGFLEPDAPTTLQSKYDINLDELPREVLFLLHTQVSVDESAALLELRCPVSHGYSESSEIVMLPDYCPPTGSYFTGHGGGGNRNRMVTEAQRDKIVKDYNLLMQDEKPANMEVNGTSVTAVDWRGARALFTTCLNVERNHSEGMLGKYRLYRKEDTDHPSGWQKNLHTATTDAAGQPVDYDRSLDVNVALGLMKADRTIHDSVVLAAVEAGK